MSSDAVNETLNSSSSGVAALPKVGAAPQARDPAEQGATEEERNTIFDNLVQVDGDVPGLVAYSIYKQNKRAWLHDFIKASGRPPTEAESRAYIIGESTERRLATYRHLAAATLAGQGPDAPSSAMRAKRPHARVAAFYLVWAIVLIAAIALLAYALHTGLSVPK